VNARLERDFDNPLLPWIRGVGGCDRGLAEGEVEVERDRQQEQPGKEAGDGERDWLHGSGFILMMDDAGSGKDPGLAKEWAETVGAVEVSELPGRAQDDSARRECDTHHIGIARFA
jgi:hypothetical protein